MINSQSEDTSRIRIHQIYFDKSQAPFLDPDFVPYFNKKNDRPDWREYHILRSAYNGGQICSNDITGYVSWKFGKKAKISGKAFIKFIKDNPNHDVYFINPFPFIAATHQNVWHQGEECHPGISDLTQYILSRAGYKIDLSNMFMDETHFAFCNFWAGTRSFWDRYMAFTEPLYDIVENQLSSHEKQMLLSCADKMSGASFPPYIFERLFSTFLVLNPDIKKIHFQFDDLKDRLKGSYIHYQNLSIMKELHRTQKQPTYHQFEIVLKNYQACYSELSLIREHIADIYQARGRIEKMSTLLLKFTYFVRKHSALHIFFCFFLNIYRRLNKKSQYELNNNELRWSR